MLVYAKVLEESNCAVLIRRRPAEICGGGVRVKEVVSQTERTRDDVGRGRLHQLGRR